MGEDMFSTIKEFIHPRPAAFYMSRNQWFYLPKLDVYLVAGFGVVNFEMASVLKISNISMIKEEDIGKGYFKPVILEIEKEAQLAGYDFVTVENTAADFALMLKKNGYALAKPEGIYDAFGVQLAKPLQPSGSATKR